jgi:hypothetical protein
MYRSSRLRAVAIDDSEGPSPGWGSIGPLLRWARHSFLFRAMLTMLFGTLMSCSGCNTCLAFALYAGCNSNGGSSLTGCGEEEEEEERLPSRETDCHDGVDNDGDGVTDCRDVDCREAGECGEYYCYDGVDDDGDGLTDCEDPDCCDDPICRCQCEARCEAGASLCISDEATCSYECCAAGQECDSGRCRSCESGCGPERAPCWTGEGCDHECCAPAQSCTEEGCRCENDCGEGTRVCLIDDQTCDHECCAEGDVCSSEGCAPGYCAAAMEVDDAQRALDILWEEQDDIVDVGELEGCRAQEGREAQELLLDVRVAPGEALRIDMNEGWQGSLHVIDGCPPTRCESSVAAYAASASLWINDGDEDEQVLVLIGASDRDQDEGWLLVSAESGVSCERAIVVEAPTAGFTWAADARLFEGFVMKSPCVGEALSSVAFRVDVGVAERLDVSAWSEGGAEEPAISIVTGDNCEALTCVSQGAGTLSLRDGLGAWQTYTVIVGWGSGSDGLINVAIDLE